jgi:protein TonB
LKITFMNGGYQTDLPCARHREVDFGLKTIFNILYWRLPMTWFPLDASSRPAPHLGVVTGPVRAPREGLGATATAVFVASSVVVHLGIAVGLSHLSALEPDPHDRGPLTVDFTPLTVAAFEPLPEPHPVEQAPPAEPPPVEPPPTRATPRAVPPPARPAEAAVPDESSVASPEPAPRPAPASAVVSDEPATAAGMPTGTGGQGGPGTGGSRTAGATSGSSSGSSEGSREIDPRVLAREWMRRVSDSILGRALRDYPRAALRQHLEGTVTVAISLHASGRVADVAVLQSSGHARLDEAAIAAVQAVGEVPAPPALFTRRGRPLTMPIRYRIR